MAHFPVFLSVVLVVLNQADSLELILAETTAAITKLVSDYNVLLGRYFYKLV